MCGEVRDAVASVVTRQTPARGSRTARLALLALAAGAATGCEAGTPATSTSRDSLGVTIVESVAPAWTPDVAWRIEDEPLLDLAETGSGDMHNFFRVRDMLRAGEHVVVADGISHEVRVFDADGRFVRAFGGSGEGPGEFGFLWTIVLTNSGTLLGVDYDGSGSEFDVTSGLIATFQMPSGATPVRHTVASDIVWGRDLEITVRDEGRRQGPRRSQATILRLSENRISVHRVASVPGDEYAIVPEGDLIPHMQLQTHIVPTGDGRVLVGTAEALEYSILDGRTGEIRHIARILGVSLAVSKEEVDRELRTRLGPNPRPRIRELLESLPEPEERPAYQRMIVDAEGNVWAGEFLGLARRDEVQEWYVWDSSGVWLGTVETPARFELMRVRADEVFGVRRDINDVEHPQVLRLVKEGG